MLLVLVLVLLLLLLLLLLPSMAVDLVYSPNNFDLLLTANNPTKRKGRMETATQE